MHWLAGDVICRIIQMIKQFGMYASSFKIVVSRYLLVDNWFIVVN